MHIAIGICLGLRACALELSNELAPVRVRLPKPLLEYRAGVDVSMLTMHFLFGEGDDDPNRNRRRETGNVEEGTHKDAPVELKDALVYFGFW